MLLSCKTWFFAEILGISLRRKWLFFPQDTCLQAHCQNGYSLRYPWQWSAIASMIWILLVWFYTKILYFGCGGLVWFFLFICLFLFVVVLVWAGSFLSFWGFFCVCLGWLFSLWGFCWFGFDFFFFSFILRISVVTFQHPAVKILVCAHCVWLIVVLMLLGAGMKSEYLFSRKNQNQTTNPWPCSYKICFWQKGVNRGIYPYSGARKSKLLPSPPWGSARVLTAGPSARCW